MTDSPTVTMLASITTATVVALKAGGDPATAIASAVTTAFDMARHAATPENADAARYSAVRAVALHAKHEQITAACMPAEIPTTHAEFDKMVDEWARYMNAFC